MHKKINPRLFNSILFVMSSAFLAHDAFATPQIQTQAIALKVIPVPTTINNCMACHTVGSATASKSNLKPGYQTAWAADPKTLNKLKALLNVLPPTTVGLVGSGLAKADVYQVYCVAGAASLSSSVIDLAPVKQAFVSTQVTKGTAKSALSVDTKDGDTVYSAFTKLAGGVGPYNVNVYKSAYTGTVATEKGAETYAGKLSCLTSAGVPVGLSWRIIQNQ